VLAECNRAPFDLAECEQELVGGFHTEYASMKWALFFLGEYAHMITGSAFFTLLFLGGWDLPLLPTPAVGGIALVLLNCTVVLAKVAACLFVMMWIRWTLPRFRFDQLMRLAWRCLVPVTLAGLLWATVMVALRPSSAAPGLWNWLMTLGNAVIFGSGLLLMNWLPEGRPTNRKVALEGSRFSAPSPV
jgi:NADH-quinone oxidoreductase subunit H